jgi:hypothetical protein
MILDNQHGLNPSVECCFLCGKGRGVVLFGARLGGREAPREVVMDMSPCDDCKKLMTLGVILLSVDESRTDDPQNPYRTGGFAIVKDSYIRSAVVPPELAEDICKHRVAFIPDHAWDGLGLPRGPVDGIPSKHDDLPA